MSKKHKTQLKVLSNEYLDDFIESVNKALKNEKRFTDDEYIKLKKLFDYNNKIFMLKKPAYDFNHRNNVKCEKRIVIGDFVIVSLK